MSGFDSFATVTQVADHAERGAALGLNVIDHRIDVCAGERQYGHLRAFSRKEFRYGPGPVGASRQGQGPATA